MNPCIRLWPALLLAGCAQISPLITPEPTPDMAERNINERSPGVTVTTDTPPRLAGLTFFTATSFNRTRARDCTLKLLQPQSPDAGVLRYTSRDMLNAEGLVENRTRVYAMLPVRDRIRFELTLLAKVSGTTYGFRRIQSARHDPLRMNGHDFTSLPPSGKETQQVYQRLQRLFQELDGCIKGGGNGKQNNGYGGLTSLYQSVQFP